MVGAAKPDKRIFERALSLACVKADEALHVGDSLKDDLGGARGAGIDALFLNRNGMEVDEAACIHSLDELIQ